MIDDPEQRQNLIEKYPDKTAQLQQLLEKYQEKE